MDNYMKLQFLSKSENEIFARNAVGAFCVQLEPSLAELNDIKTAVSEAVTNAIVHGYQKNSGNVTVECEIKNSTINITVSDEGVGIENVDEALQPFFTTLADDERSGMGFTIIQSFMNEFSVESSLGKGTKVFMTKNIDRDTVAKLDVE